MIYLIILVYCIAYIHAIKTLLGKDRLNLVINAPAFAPLIIVMALQYEVGTDYWSYIEMAQGDHDLGWIKNNNEYAFIWLNNLVIYFGEPQLIFLFSAFFQILFLMFTFRKLASLNVSVSIAFLLYFISTSLFFSSLNGVRQYLAIYMFVFAFVSYYKSKPLKYFLIILMASLFHSSAIFLSAFIFMRRILSVKIGVVKLALTYIVICTLCYFYSDVLMIELISFTQYSHYVGTDYFEKNIDAINVLTKLPKIAMVILCAYYYTYKYPDTYESNVIFINVAYFSTALMIVGLFSGPLWRFYQYFDFFTIMPLIFLVSKKRAVPALYFMISVLLVLFVIKVLLFPQGEYAYKSILV